MSTLKVNTLQDAGGSIASTTAQLSSGRCRAWANLSGDSSTPSLRRSYNISSVTDNGTGDYTFNFTDSFVDGNFSVITLAGQSSSVDDLGFSGCRGQTASSARCIGRTSRTSGMTDFPLYCIACFGA